VITKLREQRWIRPTNCAELAAHQLSKHIATLPLWRMHLHPSSVYGVIKTKTHPLEQFY